MNAEVKTKWLEALRSEKYQQGTQQLRRGDNFCCLGVLCDISEEGEWESHDSFHTYMNCITYLPTLVRMRAGLNSKQETELAKMNDGGSSFKDIAKYIEENY